jgi:hypothetical protein
MRLVVFLLLSGCAAAVDPPALIVGSDPQDAAPRDTAVAQDVVSWDQLVTPRIPGADSAPAWDAGVVQEAAVQDSWTAPEAAPLDAPPVDAAPDVASRCRVQDTLCFRLPAAGCAKDSAGDFQCTGDPTFPLYEGCATFDPSPCLLNITFSDVNGAPLGIGACCAR